MRTPPLRTIAAACGALGLAAAAALAAQPETTGQAPAAEKAAAVPTGAELEAAGLTFVRLVTTEGEIHLALDTIGAPITVENFLGYVDEKHYEGTMFHRVMKDFMVQGGGFTPDGTERPTGPGIRNEWLNGLENLRGTVAMARKGNMPDSATAQFFINTTDNWFLDIDRDGAAYAVFGTVVEGMPVVDAIEAAATGRALLNGRPAPNVPVEPILIETAERLESSKLSEDARRAAAAWKRSNTETREQWQEIKDDDVRCQEERTVRQAEGRERTILEQRKAREEAERRRAEMESAMKERFEIAQKALAERGEVTDSGLKTAVITEGEGETCPPGATVTIHYTGWLSTDGTMFDSSETRGEPATFPLGRLIRGWQEGVPMMKKGETRVMQIPPAIGYGANGSPPVIPPNATLIFEITLFDWQG